MLKFIFILYGLLQIAETTNQMENIMDKLQNKQFKQAELILKNITEINTITELSKSVLALNEPLTINFFFKIIDATKYKWHESINIYQSLDILKVLKNSKQLQTNSNTQNVLKNLEYSLINKCGNKFKLIIVNKNFKEFQQLTGVLSSSLAPTILHRCIKESLTKVYGLILHTKLLKRLQLHRNLNFTKVLFFIELFRKLKIQKALTANLTYKLALSLRYILDNENFCELTIKQQLINIKQSLPKYIILIVFSKQLCLQPIVQPYSFLTSFQENKLNITLDFTEQVIWLSYLFENNLILENNYSKCKIFVNFLNSLDDYLYEYHLKPLNTTTFVLHNSVTKQVLCLNNSGMLWQNAMEFDNNNNNNNNCLWFINNCMGLRRFIVNEYY